MKIFLFAGHDAISTTLSMVFYYLSLHPAAHAKACEEISTVFGATATHYSIASAIKDHPQLLNSLPYLGAVIKETLRLYPPANTVRLGSAAVPITDPATGTQYPTDHFVVWPDSYLIHRNPSYFPDPTSFIPERFIPSSTPFPLHPVLPGAYRPFERGPRNCIGTEYGTTLLKIALAVTLPDFDFHDAYHEDEPGATADAVVEADGMKCYQMLFGSAKPKGWMVGRIRRRVGKGEVGGQAPFVTELGFERGSLAGDNS